MARGIANGFVCITVDPPNMMGIMPGVDVIRMDRKFESLVRSFRPTKMLAFGT